MNVETQTENCLLTENELFKLKKKKKIEPLKFSHHFIINYLG